MKKWYVALVCCLALCIAGFCAASADQAQVPTIAISAPDPDTDLFSYDETTGTYSIRSDYDFDVYINASGADSAGLILGDGKVWDLREWDAWNDGSWGENHENIHLQAFYTQSSTNQSNNSYELFVEVAYPDEDPDHEPHQSEKLKINCWSNGRFADDWKPEWKYASSGDKVSVNVSSGTAMTDSFQVTRGQVIQFTGLQNVLPEGSDGLWGGIVARKANGDPDWSNVPVGQDWDGNQGTLSLFTVPAEPGDYYLALTPWKMGYDRVSALYPVTVTGSQEITDPRWTFQDADANGDVTLWTHDPVKFSVYIPGAVSLDARFCQKNGQIIGDTSSADGSSMVWQDYSVDAPMKLQAIVTATMEGGTKEEYAYPGTITVKTNGDLPAPVLSADATVRKGKSQKISFSFTENPDVLENGNIKEEYADIWHVAYLWSPDWQLMEEPIEFTVPGETYSFSTENLEVGRMYRLSVDIQKHSYTGVATDQWILVLPEESSGDAKVQITAEGYESSTAPIKVPIHQNLTFRVTSLGEEPIETVELFDGNDYWEHEGPDEDGAYTRDVGFWDAKAHSVYARVTFDPWSDEYEGLGYDPRTWYATNVIQVVAEKRGDVGAFTYTLDLAPDLAPVNGQMTLTRGDVWGITYSRAENADHYYTDFEWYDEENGEWTWVCHQGDVNDLEGGFATLSTAALPAGSYRFFPVATGVGYSEFTADSVYLTITEPQSSGEDPVFIYTVSGTDNITTGQLMNISAYAPEADWIDVLFNSYADYSWRESFPNAFAKDRSPYWAPGTYYMVLEAYFPVYDENGNPVYELDEKGAQRTDDNGDPIIKHEPVSSDPVLVTVQAGGIVEIEKPDLPSWLAPGSGLAISIPMIEGGDWMNLDVQVQNGDGSVWENSLCHIEATENGASLNISWDELVAFGIDENVNSQQTLVVSTSGGKAGYEVRGWTAFIPIVALQDDTVPEAFISFDDTETDEYTASVNTDVHLTISSRADRTPEDGEEAEIQSVRFYDGQMFQDIFSDENGNYTTSMSRGDPGTYSLYAEVTYMPWDEAGNGQDDRTWYPTNVLTLHFSAQDGTVSPFTFTLDKTTVARGETVQLTVVPPTGGNSIPAESYYIQGVNVNYDWYWADEENLVANINTTNIWPGTYLINMTGTSTGKANYYTSSQLITVTDPDMGEESIKYTINGKTSGIEVWLGEPIELSAVAPDAIRMGLYVDDEHGWHLDENGEYQWGVPTNSIYQRGNIIWWDARDLGTHRIKVVAQFEDGGEWVEKELTLTVKSKGKLTLNREGIPAVFRAGANNESVTLMMPEDAEELRVWVREVTDTGNAGDRWQLGDNFIDAQLKDEENVLQIPGEYLHEGKQIWIDVQAIGVGYPKLNEHFEIPIVGASAQSGAQMVFEEGGPNSLGNVSIDQEIRIAVIPAEGRTFDQIRFYHGVGFWNGDQDEVNPTTYPDWFREEDNAFVAEWTFDSNSVGNRAFFAYYKLNGDTDWSMTEPVSMNVTALGTVKDFDFADSQESEITVDRGEPVPFTFTKAQAGSGYADQYWIDVSRLDDGNIVDHDRYSDGTSVTLFTDGLPEGDYEVWGRAGKAGWIWSESTSRVLVHITAPAEQSLSLNIQKTSLVTQEHVWWYAYAPEATSILVEGYMNGNDYFFQSDNGDWDVDDRSYISGENNFGGHSGTAYIRATATFADGKTVTQGPIAINVTAPYGSLKPFKLYSNAYDGGYADFRIEPDANAEWYVINDIWMHDENTQNGHTYYATPGDAPETGSRSFHIDDAGDAHIGVTVYQAAYGYDDIQTTIWMRPLAEENILTLPSGLQEIEEEAFEGSFAIAGVQLPDSLTRIGSRAFADCRGLWAMVVPSSVTSFGSDIFFVGNITLYGYSGSAAESYASTNGIDFVNID